MTEAQVKKLLKENNLSWDKFSQWIGGQTVGIIDGELHYYDWDVSRFIKNKGRKDSVAEWD